MSGNNPYAASSGRYSGSSASNSNPYAPTNANNSVPPSGRYADPYLTGNNPSSISVNSAGSRDREPRRRSPNPFEQRSRDGPGSSGPGAGDRGGYGGLGRPRYGEPPQQQDGGYDPYAPGREYDRDRPKPSPQASYTQDGYARSQRSGTRDGERERRYDDSRSRERRDMRTPPQSGSPAPMPQSTQPVPSINGAMRNGYAPGTTSSSSNRYNSPYSASRRPAKSLDEVLRHIRSQWNNMEGEDCVPIKTALQLLDPSSLGLADKEEDFGTTYVDLQKSLKSVVNEHYADFNSAVGTYHKIQNAIRESQSRVRMLRIGLMSVKGGMLTTRPELRGLAEQSGELDDMVGVLGGIETLKAVPIKLEERISEKRFLTAVDLLMESLRSVRRKELDEIGAMSDLKSYFGSQEASLVDILIEELHDHLYLKSPYCQDRWKGRKPEAHETSVRNNMMGSGVNVWDRPVYQYLATLEMKAAMVEDASKNPEADTFYYMHMILEALNRLGHLEDAISRIEQRMPVELYKVVEKTNLEIDAKYPSHSRGQLSIEKRTTMSINVDDSRTQVLSDFLWTLYSKFESIAEGHRVVHEVVAGIVTRERFSKPEKYTNGFKELWKLYQVEMRSVLHDYLATDGEMTMKTGFATSSNGDLFGRSQRDKAKRMFKLSDMDQKSATVKAEQEQLDEILKTSVPGLVNKSKNKGGAMSKADRGGEGTTATGHKLLVEPGVFNMTILLRPSLAFLQHLKDIVPQISDIPMSTLTSFLDDFLLNVFHPQLEEAVTELCTQCMIDIEAFSEGSEWSRHSPYPVFKGTIVFMNLIRSFSGMLSAIPRDQMFTQLIINQLVTYYNKCFGYYRSIVSRTTQSSSSSTNTSTNKLTLKPAAAHADNGDIHDIAIELLSPEASSQSRANLVTKEVQSLLAATKSSPLSQYDIISDQKSVHQLSLIYNSMQWLTASLSQLRKVDTTSSGRSHDRKSSQSAGNRRWTLVTGLKTSNTGNQQPYLPLNAETVLTFDNTLAAFRTLAQKSLLTLHIDIRCSVLHQLSRVLGGPEKAEPSEDSQSLTPPDQTTLQQPQQQPRDSSAFPPLESGLYPYVLSSPPTSASSLILELNSDLISFDTSISHYLGPKERKFITSGMGKLVDRYMVVGADHIGVMNRHGAERMRIDATVVQQNLRDILAETSNVDSQDNNAAPNPTTARSSAGLGISASAVDDKSSPFSGGDGEDTGHLHSTIQYYTLFLTGPDSILQFIKDRKKPSAKATTTDPSNGKQSAGEVGYTYDELRTLIELCFSAALRGQDREESVKARKRMGDMLLQLGECMWDS